MIFTWRIKRYKEEIEEFATIIEDDTRDIRIKLVADIWPAIEWYFFTRNNIGGRGESIESLATSRGIGRAKAVNDKYSRTVFPRIHHRR